MRYFVNNYNKYKNTKIQQDGETFDSKKNIICG